jgi:ABC-type dipeptide/oligopeptide/nickel transport system permease component
MPSRQTSLYRYVVLRLLQIVPSIFFIMIILFLIIHLAPGNPVYLLVGNVAFTPPQVIHQMEVQFGLTQPLYVQLLVYLENTAEGNLGYSFYYHTSVLHLILEKIPLTLLLVGSSLIYSTSVGIILGIISGMKPYSSRDVAATIFSLVMFSIPFFWLGEVLIIIFSVYLHILPSGGWITLGANHNGVSFVLDVLRHLVLPVVTLGTYNLALTARVTRGGIIQTIHQDYIKTARSKGLDENKILYRHVLKNSLLPVITVMGVNLGYSITGAILVESIFAWPGVGQLLVDSIFRLDYGVLMGVFFFSSVFVLFANLATDVLYTFLDPRIRLT